LLGHSDGDVLLHALTDALLGAVAAPDIGSLFPSQDARWEGAPSGVFVERAMEIVAEEGFRVAQIDAVILAEEPRLASFFPEIRSAIARLLRVSEDVIGVKAKTMEGLGAIGRGEGMAAQAIVLVEKEEP
jgi:2-C-methyl-D-erythritol 2,4-cyclodiphosphate synthase